MSIFNTYNFGLQNPRNSATVGTATLNRPNQSKVRQVENVANYRILSLSTHCLLAYSSMLWGTAP